MESRVRQILSVIVVAAGAWLTVAAMPQGQSQQAPKQKKTQPAQPDQQQNEQKPADQQQGERRPAPIMKGKVTLKSSRQTTNAASAGFNGVGPDGKIKEAMLAGSPSEASRQKAAQLSLLEADQADVQAFAKEGNLTVPAKSGEKKGK